MAQIYLNSYLLGGNRCTVAKPVDIRNKSNLPNLGRKTIEEINSSPFIDWSRKYKTQLEDTGTTLSSLLHKSE